MLLMIFNTHLNAKHNNFRLRTLNPLRWEYHAALPKVHYAKPEDYYKKDKVQSNNKDDYEKATASSPIDPRNIIISEPTSPGTRRLGQL